ncbi:MAG: DUF1294 domain-containing protein [Ruminococcaceae bacterium]|nr:DUF1294 domain-containing protein [Oscillospiraceae bacterium]
MSVPPFIAYLLIVNTLGLLFPLVNKYAKKGFFDIITAIIAALGGSVGAILGIIFFDRKSTKENMLSRILIICLFIIQAVILLYVKGKHQEGFNFNIIAFFKEHFFFFCYLILINIMATVSFGLDKFYAVKEKSRIPIILLIGIAFMGGTLGAIAGMYLFRHKTQKSYFNVGLRVILITQLVVLLYIMNI